MKRFKELDSKEKKRAIDHLMQRNSRDLKWNGAGESETVKKRLKEITERIKFCGCGDCEYKLWSEVSRDSVIKEAQLEKSMRQAEEAFYPEDKDIIVKV